jgi:UDPglucose 6-dehydrogenase
MERLAYCDQPEAVFDGADAVLVATEWPDYRDLRWSELCARMKTPVIIDGRNCLDPALLSESGFRYSSVGRQRA